MAFFPDSYPNNDPEDDYFSFFTDGIAVGDRVLIIWTDDGDEPDMIAIGPLKSVGRVTRMPDTLLPENLLGRGYGVY